MFGLKTTGEMAEERERRHERREANRKADEQLKLQRKRDAIKDKTSRPTQDELLAMKINEELPLLNYRPGTKNAWDNPKMKRIGHVCRVPGGWIYQFEGHKSITSQFVPLGGKW